MWATIAGNSVISIKRGAGFDGWHPMMGQFAVMLLFAFILRFR